MKATPGPLSPHDQRLQEKMANFASLRIDGPKVVATFPPAIGLSPAGVREKMLNFAALGIDGPKVVNESPRALGLSPEGVRAKMANFAALGIDGPNLVNQNSSAIEFAPGSVREKMANFAAQRVDGARVVNVCPQAINFAPGSVRTKMANFAALGIEGARVVNTLPSAITYAPESVRRKMANFAALGVHGATVVNAFPPAIGYATAKIALIVATLREGQCWDQVRERWNAGRDCSLLATPVESFLLYLGKGPDKFRQRPHGAAHFARESLGLRTSALRRAELLVLLGSNGEADETFVANVGEAGALYLEKAMSWSAFEDGKQVSLADQTERSLPTSSLPTRSTPLLGSL